MIGFWRTVAAIRHVAFPVAVLVLGGLVLSGCDSFKRAVGIEKTSPDEFAVESRAPLTIPPDYDLRPPQPGASRPQEVSSANKAKTAIDNAGPGEPGKQEVGNLHMAASAAQSDANSQIADQSLSAKLLQTNDTGDAIVVEKRETSVLQGIH
jgi:hypothetical protein